MQPGIDWNLRLPNGNHEPIRRPCRGARRRSRAPAAMPVAIRQTVTLVAISKTFGAEAIEPVIAAGQRVFGENRVQEAKAKWPPLRADGIAALNCTSSALCNRTKPRRRWRCSMRSTRSIGQALPRRLPRRSPGRRGRPLLFVEINTGGEAAEIRCASRRMPTLSWPPAATAMASPISGLMCIPPLNEAPGAALRADREDRQAATGSNCCRWE